MCMFAVRHPGGIAVAVASAELLAANLYLPKSG